MKSASNSFKVNKIVFFYKLVFTKSQLSPGIVRAPHQIDVQFHNCFCHAKIFTCLAFASSAF